MTAGAIAGIFIGGAGTRMGNRPKGLLTTDGGVTIVDRWRAVLARAGVGSVVLVGAHAAYAHLGVETIDDAPPGIGPLGGLLALLERARGRVAVAVACDMPSVSPQLIVRLLAAPPATVVAPRRDGRWEPLCARYDAGTMYPLAQSHARGRDHSLQRLLDRAGAAELPLSATEAGELADWDTPADVDRGRHRWPAPE
jgi:molybdopterin-guanine dinucleotide biosynthesis protein A